MANDEKPRPKLGVENRTLMSSGERKGSNETKGSTEAGDALDQKTQLAGVPQAKHTPKPTEDGRGSLGQARASSLAAVAPKKTRIVGAGESHDDVSSQEEMLVREDPVVGWLVIEQGPGRGNSLTIGAGMNSVGRGRDQRITIDFGDNTISSSKHFFVSFDPRSGEFGVHRGDGANLTYLNGAPLYASEKLESFAVVEVGSTTLRFVALCGENFNWSE